MPGIIGGVLLGSVLVVVEWTGVLVAAFGVLQVTREALSGS